MSVPVPYLLRARHAARPGRHKVGISQDLPLRGSEGSNGNGDRVQYAPSSWGTQVGEGLVLLGEVGEGFADDVTSELSLEK